MKGKITHGIIGFLVFLALLIPTVSAATTSYCSGNNLYLVTNITLDISADTFPIRNVEMINCHYGCSNTTLMNLGYPGCIESDLLVAIIFIVGLFVAVFIIKKVSE